LELLPLPGDAGFRRYFRVAAEPSVMATYAPPSGEDLPAFVTKARALARAGVRVPRVYAVDYERGFLLQEDLGTVLMAAALGTDATDACYLQALDTLRSIQRTEPDPTIFPVYDAALLQGELALFPYWFVGRLLGLTLGGDELQLLAEIDACLVANADEQPRVVVHRDYHCRNLLCGEPDLGVVDFQDAVIGPVTYDPVSLLRDCYHRLDEMALQHYFDRYLDAMKVPPAARSQWRRWFDLMGLQRHLKVLGIFARLWLRDGKPRYLDDLPLVIRYVLEVAGHYAETQHFSAWFAARLLPELVRQPCYRDWRTAGELCVP
jgi:hypothetical protein